MVGEKEEQDKIPRHLPPKGSDTSSQELLYDTPTRSDTSDAANVADIFFSSLRAKENVVLQDPATPARRCGIALPVSINQKMGLAYS